MKKPTFRQIYEFVKSEYETSGVQIFPPKELIFNAFKKVQFKDLKCVIVGQDPYIKPGEAMGLCFSIPKNIKVPPSLKNIYKVSPILLLFHSVLFNIIDCIVFGIRP